MNSALFLKAEKIRKEFISPTKIELLKGVSLSVSKGESIAIMGASGEGKTTLLHILGTLEKFNSGVIEIAGQNIANLKKHYIRNQLLSFIFQFYNLFEDFTVLENVIMPSKIAKIKLNKTSPLQLLDEVGLNHKVNSPVKWLSGGEKQRVAIARALLNDPQLILADEPSGSLDHDNAEKIHSLLLNCSKQKNKCLIIATHNKELALMCDKIYLLSEGKLELWKS